MMAIPYNALMRFSTQRRFLGRFGLTTCVLVTAATSPLGTAFPAGCVVEPTTPDAQGPFTRHLDTGCSEAERKAYAVRAEELLAALKEGKGVDLAGVVVVGDLLLNKLPLVSVDSLQDPPPELQAAFGRQELNEVRVISGPISIRDSRVRGMISAKGKEGLLIIQGPVTMTGTTFERAVDLSRTVFLEPVDFSGSVFMSEGLFIQTLFRQPARFQKTAFGTHTRFHKATFADTVTFLRSGFNGLAEFLEVMFEQDASFSRTYFKMGAGFSGSRFRGMVDFSESTFEREAFFAFTVFEGDAYFRRSTFRALANFSDAEFQGVDDFSKVLFDTKPNFIRTKVSASRRTPGGLQSPVFLYAIAGAVVIFMVLFVLALRKGSQ